VRTRAGIILVEEGKLALIERHRSGLHYFTFPGGGVDQGESPPQAAMREAKEELGLVVQIQQKVAEVHFNADVQHYFLAVRLGGIFGTGTGEEFGEFNPVHGTYLPLWMPLDDILARDVVPHELAKLVVHSSSEGWPTMTTTIHEVK